MASQTELKDTPKWEDTKEVSSAIPKWEDTTDVAEPVEAKINSEDAPTQGEAVLRGLGQSLAGFGDEGAAVIQTGADLMTGRKLKGKDSTKQLEDLINLYRTYRDLNREREHEVDKAYPKTYLASNIVGGVATLPLTSSLQSAKAALGMSALTGLGMSDADLTTGDLNEYKKAAQDVGVSTLVGGGLYAGGKAVGGIANFLKEFKIAKGAKAGYQMGRRGFDLTRPESSTLVFKELTEMADKIGGELGQKVKDAMIRVRQSVDNAAKNGAKVDISDVNTFIDDELSRVATDLPQWQQAKDELATVFKNRVEGKLVESQKIIPQFEEKILPAKPGAEQVLRDEAELELAKLKAQGINASYQIVPSTDPQGRKILTRVITHADEPGAVNPKVKVVPHTREAEQDLREQAALEVEKLKHLGQNPRYDIVEGTDKEGRKILKRVLIPDDAAPTGGSVKAKAVYDYPEQPQQLIKEEIDPIIETVSSRQGGIGTNPNIQDAVNLRRAMHTLSKQTQHDPVKTIAERATGKLSEAINKTDDAVAKANENFVAIKQAQKYSGTTGEDKLVDENKVRGMLSGLAKESEGGDTARTTFDRAMNAIGDLDPQYAKKTSEEAYDLSQKYKVASDIRRDTKPYLNPMRTLESVSTNLGNRAGTKVHGWSQKAPNLLDALKISGELTKGNAISLADSTLPRASGLLSNSYSSTLDSYTGVERPKTPEAMGRNLYNSSDNELTGVAQKLSNDPKYKNYGSALNDALASKSAQQKNAVLFTIMQNPEMRKILFPETQFPTQGQAK